MIVLELFFTAVYTFSTLFRMIALSSLTYRRYSAELRYTEVHVRTDDRAVPECRNQLHYVIRCTLEEDDRRLVLLAPVTCQMSQLHERVSSIQLLACSAPLLSRAWLGSRHTRRQAQAFVRGSASHCMHLSWRLSCRAVRVRAPGTATDRGPRRAVPPRERPPALPMSSERADYIRVQASGVAEPSADEPEPVRVHLGLAQLVHRLGRYAAHDAAAALERAARTTSRRCRATRRDRAAAWPPRYLGRGHVR